MRWRAEGEGREGERTVRVPGVLSAISDKLRTRVRKWGRSAP